MKSKFLSLLLLMFLTGTAFLTSCQKNIDDTIFVPLPEPKFAIPAATPVNGSVCGIVVDENNTPVPSAEVSYAGMTYQADAKGFFDIKNVVLDKYVSTVTVNKTGYFKAIRSFSANATRNYLSIKLIPKTLAGNINSTTGGGISLSNGTSITFQTNSIIVKSSGAAYTGAVKIYASYIDPTSDDISDRVPGSMMGQDSANMFVLQSTGMIAVDLESPTGEALQLAAGKTANIKLPIPASLTGKAPATINTWSLDDRGVWKKEGMATRNGDSYDMQVTHFSFWNCDVPANAIYLTIHLTNQNNQPLSNTLVKLTIPNNNSWWATTHGRTDSLGNVSGLVPSNLTLLMKVFPNGFNCPTPAYTQNIGPFSIDTTINISASIAAAQSITVTGTANACNNQPIPNGTAIIYTGIYGAVYTSIVNGIYSATILQCSALASVSVRVFDFNTSAQAISGSVPVSGNPVTVPLLTACNPQQPATYTITACQLNTGVYAVGIPLNGNCLILANVNVLTPGNYNITTNNTNGMVFSASGNFTSTGVQTVVLLGSGTPFSAGLFTFTTALNPGTGCSTTINVTGPATNPAVFTLGGPGSCPNAVINGSFIVGTFLDSSNRVTLTVNVTTTGTYNINTGNNVNGMNFSDTGTFFNTGVQTVVLYGSGAPITDGAYTFQVQSAGISGCTFVINVTPRYASYTFPGAPGSCTGVQVSGSYVSGTALNTQNTVVINVNVTATGPYSISTNPANGFSFTRTGSFTSTGQQTVVLLGSGTPVTPGVNTFTTSGAGGIQGCIFTVTSN